jgi:Tfp pilus assembly protein PilP
MRNVYLRVLLLALVGCGGGDDEVAVAPAQPQGTKPAAPPPPAAPAGPSISTRMRIEDRVTSPTEKASIRRRFRESDFATELNNRDPFLSYVINQPGLEDTSARPQQLDELCTKKDQFVATTFSYSDLKLVGIVTVRAQRRALMMDPGNIGQFIKKGDCVGREKALVKDIGDGFITFAVRPEITPTGEERAMQEESKYLRPGKFEVTSQPSMEDTSTRSSVPVVAPPGSSKGAPAEPPGEKK